VTAPETPAEPGMPDVQAPGQTTAPHTEPVEETPIPAAAG